ncbi:para-aminobenzoate synthetase component 2 [Oceanobacillus limi]|uniref:Para-aminobenzoate synthetase component 2 n=1 Tax=Oceanobacillus limi TaxID=930131 RepID=A0A1I0GHN8_9BACI|nr:aminodeoxychorismate/anthranilate synthase component II [Oceanobacillus limi]SET70667.1 para-aminobenzoate synthetase component 2 [Oceanobacillus limi]
MILVIDNFDSFTYNLVQYIRQLDKEVHVVRNNAITIEDIEELNPTHILLSPGPGNPDDAGICLDVVDYFYHKIPILGVCLGHQIIAQAFGAKIIHASQPMHGKVSTIQHDQAGIFQNLSTPLNVTRYHSLLVEKASLPSCFEISAETNEGEIMALRHKEYSIEGIQAHPEAILTEEGLQLLDNFFQHRGNTR